MPDILFIDSLDHYSKGPRALSEHLLTAVRGAHSNLALFIVENTDEAAQEKSWTQAMLDCKDLGAEVTRLVMHHQDAEDRVSVPVLAVPALSEALVAVIAKHNKIGSLVFAGKETQGLVESWMLPSVKGTYGPLAPSSLYEALCARKPGCVTWLEALPSSLSEASLAQSFLPITSDDDGPEVLTLEDAVEFLLEDARKFQETGDEEDKLKLQMGFDAIVESLGGDNLAQWQVAQLIDTELELVVQDKKEGMEAPLLEQQQELRASILARVMV